MLDVASVDSFDWPKNNKTKNVIKTMVERNTEKVSQRQKRGVGRKHTRGRSLYLRWACPTNKNVGGDGLTVGFLTFISLPKERFDLGRQHFGHGLHVVF